MDFVSAGKMTHNQDSKTVEYSIENIDYWERDAILVVGDLRIYFQWDAKDHPTIEDALRFLSNEVDAKWGIKK
jgi:hypothetical protein